jgi:5-methylcytosine-specific restriction endonuclease McrA
VITQSLKTVLFSKTLPLTQVPRYGDRNCARIPLHGLEVLVLNSSGPPEKNLVEAWPMSLNNKQECIECKQVKEVLDFSYVKGFGFYKTCKKCRYIAYKARPDYKQIIKQRAYVRRQRVKHALGHHSESQWIALKKKWNNTCPMCKLKEPEITLTRDHIIPLSRDGSNNIENIQPLCTKCNSKKSTSVKKFRFPKSKVDPLS